MVVNWPLLGHSTPMPTIQLDVPCGNWWVAETADIREGSPLVLLTFWHDPPGEGGRTVRARLDTGKMMLVDPLPVEKEALQQIVAQMQERWKHQGAPWTVTTLFETCKDLRADIKCRHDLDNYRDIPVNSLLLKRLLDMVMPENLFQDGPRGPGMQTRSGRAFYPLDPQPEDIVLTDICHALASEGRYANQTELFYSVAQHSMLVASILPERLRLEGLLHDGAEAYLRDLPKGLKGCLPLYKIIEHGVEAAIATRFGMQTLSEEDRALIKQADMRVLATERRDLIHKIPGLTWRLDEEGFELLKAPIHPFRRSRAKMEFKKACMDELERREAAGLKPIYQGRTPAP